MQLSLGITKDKGFSFGESQGATGKKEIKGSATLQDVLLDAENSKLQDNAGIRTRVALGTFAFKSLPYKGVSKTVDELRLEGIIKDGEEPGLGIFATRTALRLEDFIKVKQSISPGSERASALISYLVSVANYDDSSEFRQFGKIHQGWAALGNHTPDDQIEALTDYFASLSSVVGRQAAKFEKIGAVKWVINPITKEPICVETRNNMTVMGESVDNSQIKFRASQEEMVEFQKSMLDLVNESSTLVGQLEPKPEYNHSGLTRMQLRCLNETFKGFIEGYLDEIRPQWREKMRLVPNAVISDDANYYQLREDFVSILYIFLNGMTGSGSNTGSGTDISISDQIKNIEPFLDVFFETAPRETLGKLIRNYISFRRSPEKKDS